MQELTQSHDRIKNLPETDQLLLVLVSTHRKKILIKLNHFPPINPSQKVTNPTSQRMACGSTLSPVQLNEWLCWSPYGDSLGFLVPEPRKQDLLLQKKVARHSGESTTCIIQETSQSKHVWKLIHFGINFSPGSYRSPTHLIIKSSCCALNMDSTVDIMKS